MEHSAFEVARLNRELSQAKAEIARLLAEQDALREHVLDLEEEVRFVRREKEASVAYWRDRAEKP